MASIVPVDEARLERPEISVRAALDPLAREPFRIASRPLHHVWLLTAGAPTILRRDVGTSRWSERRMLPGDINICSAGEPDFDFGWTSASGIVRPEFAQLYVHRGRVERIASEHGARQSGSEVPPRVGLRDPLIAELLRALCRCARNPHESDDLFVDSAVELLALQLLRTSVRDPRLPIETRHRPLAPAMVGRIRDFVEGNLDKPLRVIDLASLTGLSVYHFARLFRMATGETPHAFALRLRLERVDQLLRDRRRSLGEIAVATGFSSQSHLTTQYRRARGIAPGEARRRLDPSRRF